MEPRDIDITEDQQDLDVQALKRAMMRRDEAVERFRAAKAQMRQRALQDVRRQDQAPHQRQQQ